MKKHFALAFVTLALTASAHAQQEETPQPKGKIILQREDPPEESPEASPQTSQPTASPNPPASQTPLPEVDLTEAERNAPTFTAYDLDVHITPAAAHITVHARLGIRNDGTQPLTRLAMQLSSTLHWEQIAQRTTSLTPVPYIQQTIDTDADHTGKASEAVLTLAHPLAPGAQLNLDVFYSGTIEPSAERLERIGAPHDQAIAADWDAIAPDTTSLRGFGNVLWYPVAAAPALLGDEARLFDAISSTRLRESAASIHLRLTVEYAGEPPDAAYFCGRRATLTAITESPDEPTVSAPGVATADFPAQPLGFRAPSLFLTDRAPQRTVDGLISAITANDDALPAYATASREAQPLLTDWLGPDPLTTLTLLDHPGQPFEDGPFVAAPLRALPPATLAPSLVHLLSHAWFPSTHPWLEEGVPQFLSLLWTERTQGREATLNLLQQAALPLALAEADVEDKKNAGQSLLNTGSDVFFRNKAAAVLWMLRALAGDDALKHAFDTYRHHPKLDADPESFERTLEQVSGKDLRWFFDDWVYHDRGLPDLTIVSVTPSEVTAQRSDSSTWLVAVNVRNEGGAAAEVPITVRSSTYSTTEHLRIPAHASSAIRILFNGRPEEVLVNDGTIPELRGSLHSRKLTLSR